MRIPLLHALLGLGTALGCATAPAPATDVPPAAAGPRWVASPFDARYQVWTPDGAGDLDTLIASLDGARVVFLGETHLDDVTHQVELAVLQGLADRHDNHVVLTMEQFERDAQPALDAYLAGTIDEPTFLKQARPWGNYREAYRPLIEFAKARGLRVVGANFPAPLRRVVAGSAAGWAKLTADQQRFVPRELFPATAAYWARVDRAVRGHGAGGDRSPDERLYDTQNLWDNAMGEAVADAVAHYPDHVILHVAGGFHVGYHDGTVAQFRRRNAQAPLRTISVQPTAAVWAPPDASDFDVADVLIFAASTARDEQDGRYGVDVGGELRYRLHVPATATDDARVPLVIWLGDDGARDTDGLAFWRLALGDAAAVASCDPFHLTEEADLSAGGRWYWPETFSDDANRASQGIARMVDYLGRRFPIDPERVVVAGEGTGATTVLWAALYNQSAAWAGVAAWPRKTGKLRFGGLPGHAPVTRGLHLIGQAGQEGELSGIQEEYDHVGCTTTVTTVVGDDCTAAPALEAAVRRELGLPVDDALTLAHPDGGDGAGLSPTAGRWARLYARATAGTEVPPLAPASFATAHLVPLAPGPFGGTTVVVVPADADDATRAAWAAVAADDPLQKRSRFHRMALAYEDGEPSLGAVLADLRAAGRRTVLVVPAVFCAAPDRMRALGAAAADSAEGLTLHWSPGLGLRLALQRH